MADLSQRCKNFEVNNSVRIRIRSSQRISPLQIFQVIVHAIRIAVRIIEIALSTIYRSITVRVFEVVGQALAIPIERDAVCESHKVQTDIDLRSGFVSLI